jgi:hypothetical protein
MMNDRWANYLEQEQKQELTESLSAEGYQIEETAYLSGDAAASIVVENDGSNGQDGLTIHTVLPFTYDVIMDDRLKILEATCVFDVTSWYE